MALIIEGYETLWTVFCFALIRGIVLVVVLGGKQFIN